MYGHLTDQLRRPDVTEEQAREFIERLENGETVPQAATMAGIHRQTGYRLLSKYQAKVEVAAKVLAVKAIQAAEDWVLASKNAAEKGDHKPAKELLQTIGAVAVIGENGGSQVVINIGSPDLPIQAEILRSSPDPKLIQSEND